MREKERERETSFFLRDATIARFARSDSLPRVKERERERRGCRLPTARARPVIFAVENFIPQPSDLVKAPPIIKVV